MEKVPRAKKATDPDLFKNNNLEKKPMLISCVPCQMQHEFPCVDGRFVFSVGHSNLDGSKLGKNPILKIQ